MKKQVLFMVVLLAAVGLLAGVAANNALATSGNQSPCVDCHAAGGAAPTVALVTNNGATVTYSVTDATAHEWAIFIGTTRIAGTQSPGNTGQTGTFTVPAGSTFTVYAEYGEPGPATSGSFTATAPGGASSYTITPTAGANGSISPATPQSVASGGHIVFTMTPAAGYEVADVLVNGASVGAVASYDITNVTANGTISATFRLAAATTFSIVPTAGEHGSISPAAEQTVNSGSDATFTITPDKGYYIDTLKVDGVAVQPAKSYTFTKVAKDHSIAATFAPTPPMCAITASVAGANGGTILPGLSSFTLPAGAGVTYYFVPDEHFHVDSLLVDGWPVTVDADDDSYTFWSVDSNHTLVVDFAPNTWKMTASVSGKGSITPSGTQTVSEGAGVTYTFAATAGNSISDVIVDGVSMGIQTSYTFSDITENHTIQAKFVANSANFTVTPSVDGVGGIITPYLPFTVPSGAGITFYFLPSDGFEVGTVKVDGAAVDPKTYNDDNSYTFDNVTANHAISVAFVRTPAPAKLATSTTLKASAKTIKRNHYVTLTATLKGGTFTNTTIRFEVKKAGAKSYKLLKAVKVSSTGVAKYRYKVTAKGTRYHRVRFLGNDTYLPAPLKSGIKLVVK